jgi:hypothetical protein
MFETTGKEQVTTVRSPNTFKKLERLRKALRHEEPDRVPISDFFWGGFIRRWRQEPGLPADANPYCYYDFPMPEFMSFETDTLEKLEEVVMPLNDPPGPGSSTGCADRRRATTDLRKLHRRPRHERMNP